MITQHSVSIEDVIQQLDTQPDEQSARYKPGQQLQAHDACSDYIVFKTDLQKMVAMGLGALPVEAVGVPEPCLRTNLLTRLLDTENQYKRRLTDYFPVYFVAALYELQSITQRFKVSAYVIGGLTRDLLRFNEKYGNQVGDIDITIEGDAIDFATHLMKNSRNFHLEESFPEFGTAKVRYKESLVFDLASTREEVYPHCGALPHIVRRGVPLEQDIIRRDFTVNAIALSIHELGSVVDFSHGIEDIKKQQLRILHPLSFFEDPSRILRAMKFAVRFNFTLSVETEHLLKQFLAYGSSHYRGGGERIKQELKDFLMSEESGVKAQWIQFFLHSGCYRLLNMEETFNPLETESVSYIAHHGKQIAAIESALYKYLEPDFLFLLYLALYYRDFPDCEFQHALNRLGLTRTERECIEQYRVLHPSILTGFDIIIEFSSATEVYDLFSGLRLVTVAACMVEYSIRNPEQTEKVIEAFLTFKRKWESIQLDLNGNDLQELGVPQGKQIGILLHDLLHAKLMGRVPERLDEVVFIQKRIQQLNQNGP
jgi:tRNA nucleotidyltransferase (CCA-adding enzyme)